MKKVINFLPIAAIIFGSVLALATTNKYVAGTWGRVDPQIVPSGWVNIHDLPPGYIDYDCIPSDETCLFYTEGTENPSSETGIFVLIPDED